MKRLFSLIVFGMGLLPFPTNAQDTIIGNRPQTGAEVFVLDPEHIQVEVWAQDLAAPWSLAFLPDGRALVSERRGTIRLLSQDGGYEAEPLLTLDVDEDDESGLMGLAVHPNFPNAPFVYAMRTFRRGAVWNNEVLRLTFDGEKLSFEAKLIENIPAGDNHNGGRLGFGPDGMLYVGTGDIFERHLAQDLNSLAGKILRITPNGTVPADNPFVGSMIWSWGHRNVQGLAWDPNTGAFYNTEHGPSGEVGFGAFDEVNLVEKGGNFGWPLVVGAAGEAGLFDPVVVWPDRAVPPSGAAFWQGDLYVATLGSEALVRIVLENERAVGIEHWFTDGEHGKFGRLRDAVRGPDGALYVLTGNNDWRGEPRPRDDKILRLTNHP